MGLDRQTRQAGAAVGEAFRDGGNYAVDDAVHDIAGAEIMARDHPARFGFAPGQTQFFDGGVVAVIGVDIDEIEALVGMGGKAVRAEALVDNDARVIVEALGHEIFF